MVAQDQAWALVVEGHWRAAVALLETAEGDPKVALTLHQVAEAGVVGGLLKARRPAQFRD